MTDTLDPTSYPALLDEVDPEAIRSDGRSPDQHLPAEGLARRCPAPLDSLPYPVDRVPRPTRFPLRKPLDARSIPDDHSFAECKARTVRVTEGGCSSASPVVAFG